MSVPLWNPGLTSAPSVPPPTQHAGGSGFGVGQPYASPFLAQSTPPSSLPQHVGGPSGLASDVTSTPTHHVGGLFGQSGLPRLPSSLALDAVLPTQPQAGGSGLSVVSTYTSPFLATGSPSTPQQVGGPPGLASDISTPTQRVGGLYWQSGLPASLALDAVLPTQPQAGGSGLSVGSSFTSPFLATVPSSALPLHVGGPPGLALDSTSTPPQHVGGLRWQSGLPRLPSSLALDSVVPPLPQDRGSGLSTVASYTSPYLGGNTTSSSLTQQVGRLHGQLGLPQLPFSLASDPGSMLPHQAGGLYGQSRLPSSLAQDTALPPQPAAGGSGRSAEFSSAHPGLAFSASLMPPQTMAGGSSGIADQAYTRSDLAPLPTQSRTGGSGLVANHMATLPSLAKGLTPFRPWSPSTAYEPISPPTNVEAETVPCTPSGSEAETLDSDSLPALLRFMGSIDSSLVSSRPLHSDILSEAEFLARTGRTVEEDVVSAQSPLLAQILSKIASEIKGKEASEEGSDFRSPGPKPLRQGQFLPASKKLRAFSKPSPPMAPGALPLNPLRLSESDKSILPSHEGKSNVNLSSTLSDKTLSDWEETIRLGLENSSMAERLATFLFKDGRGEYNQALSTQQRETLLLAQSSFLRASLTCMARSYYNVVLARRDAVLAKAKARLPLQEKETFRVLPLDSCALFGKGVTDSPFLQPPSETSLALREVTKALAPKRQTGGQSSDQKGTKRKFNPSAKDKSPKKKFRSFTKPSTSTQGKKPSSSSKPSHKSKAHPQ